MSKRKKFVFKILIGGDAGAGKTTILRRYVDRTFDESTIHTVGVDFFLKQINIENTSITLQLWDLGGQQRFRHLLDNFIMGARGALFLFDLTRMPNMKKVSDWIEMLRTHKSSLPIILVGTKSDLEDLIAVDKETALKMKKNFTLMDYIETSSKTGKNVDKVFEQIAKIVLKISRY